MATHRNTFHWRPGSSPEALAEDSPLAERIRPLVDDRASPADELVREASELLVQWLLGRPEGWRWQTAHTELDDGLAELSASQAWRAPVAHWFDVLRRVFEDERLLQVSAREVLVEELGLWLGGETGDAARDAYWNGRPLAPGSRLPDRVRCAPSLVADLERGETIFVHGYSRTVGLVILEAQKRGLAPHVVVTEGSPDLAGRRMADWLAAHGVALRLVYDAAALGEAVRSDRIWLGTEAIGAHAFLARVGTVQLIEEAHRQGVPVIVVATSDKLMPQGQLDLPRFCQRDRWLLWEHAPEGVEVASQFYEEVPLALADYFATEYGAERVAELSLRCLRTDDPLSLVDL